MAKNRFGHKQHGVSGLSSILLPVGSFAVLFALFLSGLSSVSQTTQEKQLQSLTDAIRRSAVHCYAVEGSYPASLSYLTEHYGIQYEKDKYLVDYQVFASNLMPEITVIAK